MAELDHSSIIVANSYAETLLDLAKQANLCDEVLDEFDGFIGLMNSDPVFGDFIISPAVDPDNRCATLEKHLRGRLSDLLLNTLLVINRKGRSEIIRMIHQQFRSALEEYKSEVEVKVTSAVELTDDLRDNIRQSAAKISGKSTRLTEKVDASILGGLVIQIEDQKIDNSILRRLGRLRSTLTERASQEIHSGRDFCEEVGA